MADETTRWDASEGPAPSMRITRPDELTPLILDLSDPAQREFGDYELLQMIGQGGMGIVYRARQRSLDRVVAVKLLATASASSRDFIARFKSEAQRAARMQHPNIVTIHEIGATDRFSYFSMQLVEGETLAERMQRDGAMAPAEAARALRVLAEAVEYAHELNVLHLDLKPANVLVDSSGRLYIADFGLARPLDQALSSQLDEISGTPSYMAPEQIEIRRHRLSRATDIYGLGAILYELLTARPPFRGGSTQETLRKVLSEPPVPLRKQVRKLSRDLEAICLKCLAKDPAQRYSSARELALDLGRYLDGHAISIRRPNVFERLQRWRRQHAVSLGAMIGLFVLLLGAIVFYAWTLVVEERKLEVSAEISEAAARAMLGNRPSARARGRDFLDRALDAGLTRDGTRLLAAQMAYDTARATGNAPLLQDAQLVLAYRQAEGLWVQALRARGTPAALLTSLYFDEPGADDDAEARRWIETYQRAVQATGDDVVLLGTEAQMCRMFQDQPECKNNVLRDRLRRLEPDNAFTWAVSGPRDYKDKADRFAREASYWAGRKIEYRNHEREWYQRMLAELEAVAPAVMAKAKVGDVSARQLLTFTALSHLTFGLMEESQARLDGLREWCLGTPADAQRDATCAAMEQALAQGGYSRTELGYLKRWREKREGKDTSAEDKRIEQWQRSHYYLIAQEAVYEPDAAYLHDLSTLGVQVAEEKLLQRHGVPLLPPAGWQPPKR